MAQEQVISIYGIHQFSDEEKFEKRERLYNYIRAMINTQDLNPTPDYDGEMQLYLLKQIAVADLLPFQREELVSLLMNEGNEH